MPRRYGTYDHLNEDNPVHLSIEMDALAEKIDAMNYGAVRFLAAFVRSRRKTAKYSEAIELADRIEQILNEGLF